MTLINSLPGKLFIRIGKRGYTVSTKTDTYKSFTYILDTNALIGTPGRWTLISGFTPPPGQYNQTGFNSHNDPVLPLLYFSEDKTNKVTYVYSVTAK